MHVALVCPYSLDTPGGVATHVLGLAAWLVSHGDEATVIAPGTGNPIPPEGVSLHLVGRSFDLRFNGSVAQLAVLRGQCRRARNAATDADVVHVHEPLTPGIAFAVARHAENLVVTHHASFTPSRVLTAMLRHRSELLTPQASIAVSRAAQQTALAATGRISELIGNGVILPKPPAERKGWRGGVRPRVGFLGRLDEPRKGFAIFREVAHMVQTAGLDAEFIALGPGTVEPGRVRLLGAVDDTTRNLALQRVDILLAPNLYGESFGLILVEALAAGCSVVASDLPGFRDVLTEAGTGLTFPTGDVASALVALRARLGEPEDPRKLHESARSWSWGALGPRVRERYDGAVARPTAP